MTTTNLADFKPNELGIAGKLLIAVSEGKLPKDFYNDGVILMKNNNSGNIFLTNDDYQVAMFRKDGKTLESFYTLMGTGTEGFLDELIADFYNDNITDTDDLEQLRDICEYSDDPESDEWVKDINEYLEEM